MKKNRRAPTPEPGSGELESLPATFLRVNTRDVMERVKFGGERILIETFGRPMVVLISYQDYLCIREHLPSFAAKPADATTAATLLAETDGNALPGAGSRDPDSLPPDA